MSMIVISVVPYNPGWVPRFQSESARLAGVFNRAAIAIEHIGSTSIPAIHAKPIIDILIQVEAIDRVDELNPRMSALGYLPKGENGLDGRRFFIKGRDNERMVNVHAFETGHPEIARCLDFRDFLRAHPDHARAYSELKKSLAARYPHDLDGYMAGKDDFIKKTIALAQAWRQVSSPPRT